MPQAIKSIEIIQGEGAGSINQINFAEGSNFKCMKHYIEELNEETFIFIPITRDLAMESIVGPIIVDFIKLLWNPIGKCIKYHKSLHENMIILKRDLEELNSQKEDIKSRRDAELHLGKETGKEVENWLENVERINSETQAIEQRVAKVNKLLRARLGKLVDEKIREVKEFHQKGSSFIALVIDAPLSGGLTLPVMEISSSTSLERNINRIWEYLMDEEIRKIGVYGMGGVGKTTILKHINNRLLKKENVNFDYAIWVTVSKALNIFELQKNIARALKEEILEEEDEMRRAGMVSEMMGSKKYVLILDDLWEKIDLEKVGIPEPTRSSGCKLILTTRSSDVCRYMGCKEFKVEVLSKEEAWNLFSNKVGQDVLDVPSLEPLVKQVAEECAGLPLAIVTIACSMRKVYAIHQWKNALNELKDRVNSVEGRENEVFERLEFSYNRLQDLKIKFCFLCCSLYPEDFDIPRKELVNFWIIEGLVDEMRSRKDQFDRGLSIVDMLVNNCLLQSSSDDTSVKMHDLMRDMALKITRKNPRFMVKAGMLLRELPNEEEWGEDLEKVSLMFNHISQIPSGTSPCCPTLSTLILRGNFGLTSVPSSFFENMHTLRVLDLSNTLIDNLPNSVSDLENLTALLLGQCYYLIDVPSLAKLRSLQVLDLSDTKIFEVPRGMDSLVNLKCLYMDHTYMLKMFPTGILPRLSHLQHLRLHSRSENVAVRWEEVEGLRELEEFKGPMYLHDYNRYVASRLYGGLSRYYIIVGDPRHGMLYVSEYMKTVSLTKCNLISDPITLPHDIEYLQIDGCDDMGSCLCDVPLLWTKTAILELKACEIYECDSVECIWSSSSTAALVTKEIEEVHCSPLQSLETLFISRSPNFSALFMWGGIALPRGTLLNLKQLCISACPKLKKLFSPRLLQHLHNLKQIVIEGCEQMEEVIIAGDEERTDANASNSNHSSSNNINQDTDTAEITLPMLTFLALVDLPVLKSIYCGMMVCDSIEEIGLINCPQLKRLPLSLPMLNGQPSHPPVLRQIVVDGEEWWESLEWDHPNSKNLLQPFVDIVPR
ncbi:hypothetical protein F0562_000395 [Nyssa sinensis]|uniref:Uncharacterized protein n=1 Tax=Nyssa sinensis TaxID=561372 RepID=A0A5J5C538_9ASTE|nr:hypothetical protein F0562_000395 [Nyssa sinensis]